MLLVLVVLGALSAPFRTFFLAFLLPRRYHLKSH